MLLLPQIIPADAYIEEWHHINVRTSVTDTETDTIVSDNTYSVYKQSSLPFTDICKQWYMDYKYTFRLAVGLEASELAMAVTDWTETKEIILGDE